MVMLIEFGDILVECYKLAGVLRYVFGVMLADHLDTLLLQVTGGARLGV